MGSLPPSPDELTVLVTGFGPFKELYPKNPSWEIASSLPDHLPPERAKDAAARTRSSTASEQEPSSSAFPGVRIVVHPEAVRVNYQTVRALIPTFWDGDRGGPEYDLAIHIGMAGPPTVYSVERLAHRDGYALRDVDGEFLDDDQRRENEGERWVWHGVPSELETDIDVDDVYRRWVERSPKTEGTTLRISTDPGRYLCDFIYFSSLAHLWRQKRRRRVLFLHVPAGASPAQIDLGRELVLQLIRSAVESEVARRRRGEPEVETGTGIGSEKAG